MAVYTELNNKVVTITGGSKGIGFGMARAFAAQGCSLKLVARDAASLEQARIKLVEEFSVTVDILASNLSTDEGIDAVIPILMETDILINSAGAMGRGTILEVDPIQFRDAWEGKVMSTIFLTRALYPFLQKKKSGGCIVNVIGIAAERLNTKSIGTSTANAALVAFTKAMGSESVDDNIRINGISPGLIRTGRTEGILNPKTEVDRRAYEALVSKLPYGRMGEPSEIADLAVFLCSDSGKYISGEVISVDGGARYRY